MEKNEPWSKCYGLYWVKPCPDPQPWLKRNNNFPSLFHTLVKTLSSFPFIYWLKNTPVFKNHLVAKPRFIYVIQLQWIICIIEHGSIIIIVIIIKRHIINTINMLSKWDWKARPSHKTECMDLWGQHHCLTRRKKRTTKQLCP